MGQNVHMSWVNIILRVRAHCCYAVYVCSLVHGFDSAVKMGSEADMTEHSCVITVVLGHWRTTSHVTGRWLVSVGARTLDS